MFLSPSFNGDSFNGIPLPFSLLAAAPLSLCPGSCVQGYGKGDFSSGCWRSGLLGVGGGVDCRKGGQAGNLAL